jgi:hypothetical protein
MSERQKLVQKRAMQAEGDTGLFEGIVIIFITIGLFAMFLQLLEMIVKGGR